MKRKVLIISSFPAPYRVGVFKKLSEYYDIDLFFGFSSNENRNPNWYSKKEDLNYEILDNKKSIQLYKKCLKNISAYDFVLIYDINQKPAIKLAILCIIKKMPYFVNCDGAFIKKSIIKTLGKRFLFRNACACFSSGKSASNYFLYYGVKKENIFEHNFTSLTDAEILKKPILKDEKLSIKRKYGLQNYNKIAISVGQFIYRKGFDILLNSWKSIDLDSTILIIIGGGNLKIDYLNFINKESIKNIKIIDFLESSTLRDYYKMSDLFIFPTREDIWGLVINEAMANGLPIISSNMCIAANELVVQGMNGFTYNFNDNAELTKLIKKILEDDELRNSMSINNINKMQGNTIENVAKSHVASINKKLNFN